MSGWGGGGRTGREGGAGRQEGVRRRGQSSSPSFCYEHEGDMRVSSQRQWDQVLGVSTRSRGSGTSMEARCLYLRGIVELLQGVTGAFPTAAIHHEGIPPHYCKNTGDTNKNRQFIQLHGAAANHPGM